MATQLIEDEDDFGTLLPVIVVNELRDDGGIAQAHTLSVQIGTEPSLFSVGRDASCDVCLDHASVSRNHATIGGCPHVPDEGPRFSEPLHRSPAPRCPLQWPRNYQMASCAHRSFRRRAHAMRSRCWATLQWRASSTSSRQRWWCKWAASEYSSCCRICRCALRPLPSPLEFDAATERTIAYGVADVLTLPPRALGPQVASVVSQPTQVEAVDEGATQCVGSADVATMPEDGTECDSDATQDARPSEAAAAGGAGHPQEYAPNGTSKQTPYFLSI